MTPEERNQLFALYWGQDVFARNHNNGTRDFSGRVDNLAMDNSEGGFLLLKPLSSITDEDAIEIGKMVFYSYREYPEDTTIIPKRSGNTIGARAVCDNFLEDEYYSIWYDKDEVPMEVSWYSDIKRYKRDYIHAYGVGHIDFLRSKGYALPFKTYSVKELIKEGFIKLQS